MWGKTKHDHKQHTAYANVGEMCSHIDKPYLCTQRRRRDRFAQRCALPSLPFYLQPLPPNICLLFLCSRGNPTCTAEAAAVFVVWLGFVLSSLRQMLEAKVGVKMPAGQRSKGRKKVQQAQLIGGESFIWGFMSLCPALSLLLWLFWKFLVKVCGMTRHFLEWIP